MDKVMTLRLPSALDEQLTALAAQLPATTKSGLVRVLVERALRELGGDVTRLLQPAAPKGQP
jgi:predicted DNA-binding protein